MTPRADTHQHAQANLRAGFQEFPQVALAAPIPRALDLLMVNPKHVGGHDADPAGLHFEQLVPPFGLRASRIVKLARNGHPWLPVAHQAATVHRNGVATGRGCRAHMKACRLRCRRASRCVEGKHSGVGGKQQRQARRGACQQRRFPNEVAAREMALHGRHGASRAS